MVEDDELPKSSGKRKHSDVWDHFEEVEVLSKKKKKEKQRERLSARLAANCTCTRRLELQL